MCPGLTCSQEAESHTAEEPGAHGSIRNPRLLPAGGGAPGVSGVSADPSRFPDWNIAYDVTALCLCRLPLFNGPLSITQGWLLYATPCPAQPLSKGWV